MDNQLRCPQCRQPITAGAVECSFCGHRMSDFIVVKDDGRTWQETTYLVFSALLAVQGVVMIVIGLVGAPPLMYAGFGLAVLGIALFRAALWAQWVARVFGILALLGSGRNALQYGLSIGTVPNAAAVCLLSLAFFVYWAVLEYLLWAVAE